MQSGSAITSAFAPSAFGRRTRCTADHSELPGRDLQNGMPDNFDVRTGRDEGEDQCCSFFREDVKWEGSDRHSDRVMIGMKVKYCH